MDHKDLLNAEIAKIYQALSDPKNPYHLNNPSLLSGKTGIALFIFHYARMTGDSDAKELGIKYLEELMDSADKISDFSLGSGLLGVNWLFHHLAQNDLIDFELDLEGIDNLSKSMIDKYKLKQNYDAFFGLVSIGNFYLDQRQLSDSGIVIIDSIVNALISISQKDDVGLYWRNYFSVVRSSEDQIAYDFGLAHGTPSIIVFLARVEKRQILKKSLELIIQDAALWLLSKEGDYGFGRFPNKVIDSISKGQNRIAWCYGDLAVGIAMLNASEVCSNKLIKDKANEIMQQCSERKLDRSAVFHFLDEGYVDAGFCHGSVGNAFIFWKLWKTYSDENFHEAYKYWLDLTFRHLSDRPLGGYVKLQLDEEHPQCELVTGLLDGAAGIGMCYISFLDNDSSNSKWETIFSI